MQNELGAIYSSLRQLNEAFFKYGASCAILEGIGIEAGYNVEIDHCNDSTWIWRVSLKKENAENSGSISLLFPLQNWGAESEQYPVSAVLWGDISAKDAASAIDFYGKGLQNQKYKGYEETGYRSLLTKSIANAS